MDARGELFGTTDSGGDPCNAQLGCVGLVFKFTPDGTQSQYTVLHSFCHDKKCTGGAKPLAGVTVDNAGNIFGTTSMGGAHGRGIAFELNSSFQILHSFCSKAGCAEGQLPEASLTLDGAGHLFGTAWGGGSSPGGGTVFQLSPKS